MPLTRWLFNFRPQSLWPVMAKAVAGAIAGTCKGLPATKAFGMDIKSAVQSLKLGKCIQEDPLIRG